jgi:hypothetical protein
MKRIHFRKSNNLSQLHDEILAAVPALRSVPNPRGDIGADGNIYKEPIMTHVEGEGDHVWLTVPNGTDEAALQAVVDAHRGD